MDTAACCPVRITTIHKRKPLRKQPTKTERFMDTGTCSPVYITTIHKRNVTNEDVTVYGYCGLLPCIHNHDSQAQAAADATNEDGTIYGYWNL